MPETVVQELQRYVAFDGVDDGQALHALHDFAAPRFGAIADTFYGHILAHEGARAVLTGGEAQVARLKTTLGAWMDTLLTGPWDEAYWEHRHAIGRVHVRIGLPQHYMFGGMAVIRTELAQIAWEAFHRDPPVLERVRNALGKILDLELAVMLESYRDDLLAQQARVERLSTFGQLVASIGHDLRNPLAVVETSLFVLRKRAGDDPTIRKHVDRIGEQIGIANGIITNLLEMVRDRPLQKARVALADVVAGALSAVKRPPEIAIRVEGFGDLPAVDGDPIQLRQVIVNLVENAVYAASPEGEVAIRGRANGDAVEFAVEDTGRGVDPATRRRLFEPLITTKERGVGLGLALVKRIAERHGGSVVYADRPGGGARFTVRLPMS